MKIFVVCLLFLLGGTGGNPYSVKNLVRRQIITEAPSETTKIPPPNSEVRLVVKVPCNCPFTPQYAPVCGSDGQNYGNTYILNCARFCGSNVTQLYAGTCNNRG